MTTPLTKLAFHATLQSLLKSADRREEKPEEPQDLLSRELPMDSLGAILADYLTPGVWGAERAGRADAIADAAGAEAVPFSLRMPGTANFLATMLGSGVGAGTGALLFGTDHDPGRLPVGVTAGAALGGLYGTLAQSAHRRDLMRGVLDDARDRNVEEDPETVKYTRRPFRNLLLPYGGFHRYGRNRMMELLENHDAIGPRTTGGRVANVTTLLPYLNLLTTPAVGAGKGYLADAAQRRTRA